MRANKEELIEKVIENFDRITGYGWNTLIKLALNVTANGKPDTLEQAIKQIEYFYETFSEEDNPAWLLQSNPFNFKTDYQRILTNHI